MPLLGGLLAGLFGGVFQFALTYVTRKAALAAAWVATFAALTTALVAAGAALAAPLLAAVPEIPGLSHGFYGMAVDWGLGVGAVVVSVDALCYVYRWNVSNLTLLSRA